MRASRQEAAFAAGGHDGSAGGAGGGSHFPCRAIRGGPNAPRVRRWAATMGYGAEGRALGAGAGGGGLAVGAGWADLRRSMISSGFAGTDVSST